MLKLTPSAETVAPNGALRPWLSASFSLLSNFTCTAVGGSQGRTETLADVGYHSHRAPGSGPSGYTAHAHIHASFYKLSDHIGYLSDAHRPKGSIAVENQKPIVGLVGAATM